MHHAQIKSVPAGRPVRNHIATYGQDKRYPIGSSTNMLNNFRKQITATKRPNGLSRLQLQLSPSAVTLPAAQ